MPKCPLDEQAVEYLKKRFPVHAWGLADTTLKDVFIKVASKIIKIGILPKIIEGVGSKLLEFDRRIVLHYKYALTCFELLIIIHICSLFYVLR